MKSCVIDTWRKYGWYFRYCSVAPWAIPHQNTEYGDGRVTNKGKQCQNAWIWHSLYPADNGRQQSHVRCWCWVELSTNLREVSQYLELAFSLLKGPTILALSQLRIYEDSHFKMVRICDNGTGCKDHNWWVGWIWWKYDFLKIHFWFCFSLEGHLLWSIIL